MPEGPFGFPRLTDLGPFSKESVDSDITARELDLRSHSIRNYSPEEFYVAAENSGRHETLDALHTIEAGRFESMLEETFKFFEPLDEDEREEWANNNPLLIRWLNAWAHLNRTIQFKEYE